MELVKYLEGHAYYFATTLSEKEIKKNDYLHFAFSIHSNYFLAQNLNPGEILKKVLEDLLKQTTYRVKNGKKKLLDGTIKQTYTKRIVNLKKDVVASAIHLKDVDLEEVEPHIHLLLKKDARLGKDFSLLKTHILHTLKKYNLYPHFAEKELKVNKNLQARIKKFTWSIRKATNKNLKTLIKKPDFIDKLELLYIYAQEHGQFSYYAKTMFFLQKRLNYLKEDLIFKGVNLRHIIPVPLNETEQKALIALKDKDFKQTTLKALKESKILRDYYKYCKTGSLNNAYYLKLIKQNTKELPILRKNKTFEKNYQKIFLQELKEKLNKLDKDYYDTKPKLKEDSIYETLKNDLLKVAQACINEKELRQEMQKLGYKNFGFFKKQGKVQGYKFTLKNENYRIECTKSVDISTIRSILKQNYLEMQKGSDLEKTKQEEIKINKYNPKPLLLPKPKDFNIKLKKEEEIKKIKEIRKENTNEYRKRIRELIEQLQAVRAGLHTIKDGIQTIRNEIQSTNEQFNGNSENNVREVYKRGIKDSYKERINSLREGITGRYRQLYANTEKEYKREFVKEFREQMSREFKSVGTKIRNRINEFRDGLLEKIERGIREKFESFRGKITNILTSLRYFKELQRDIKKDEKNDWNDFNDNDYVPKMKF